MKLHRGWLPRSVSVKRFSKADLLLFALLFGLIGTYIIFQSLAATSTGVTVSGNQTLKGGQPFIMRGVNRSGSEYMCLTSAAFFDGPNGTDDSAQIAAMKTWGINTVNIPFNEDCWLGINGAAYGGTSYQNTLKAYVSQLEANGITPVLALFWTAPGTQIASGHGTMPDADHTPTMWQSVANTFKNDPYVVFRIDEEPHPGGGDSSNAAWDCWKNGDVQYAADGTLTPVSQVTHCSESFKTIGMQSMINIIRGTGATNVIQVPGIAWSNYFRNFLNPTYKVVDTLNPAQLMAAADIYPIGNGCDSGTCNTADYDTYLAPIAQVMPLISGEIGPDVNMATTNLAPVDSLLTWLDQHGGGYMAWVWDTWGETDDIISSYPGTVRSPWGTDFKNHLASINTTSPPTIAISVNPATIITGSSSTLVWSATNATSCTASNGWSGTKATSGTQTITPPATASYTLTCTGAGGSASNTVSIIVSPVSGKTGDINGDNQVNIFDLSILLSNYGSTTTSCDLNHDGAVNIFDLSILLSNYGK